MNLSLMRAVHRESTHLQWLHNDIHVMYVWFDAMYNTKNISHIICMPITLKKLPIHIIIIPALTLPIILIV